MKETSGFFKFLSEIQQSLKTVATLNRVLRDAQSSSRTNQKIREQGSTEENSPAGASGVSDPQSEN